VFTASGLAREILLTLTGPRSHDRAARDHDRAASARLRRVLVDELREAPEQPLQLPEPQQRHRRLHRRHRHHARPPPSRSPPHELSSTSGREAQHQRIVRMVSRKYPGKFGRQAPRVIYLSGRDQTLSAASTY
jgi:hypothetical protein